MPKRPFRLQYASDIHLEFQEATNISFEKIIKPVAAYLALCGDIGYPEQPALLSFLSWCSRSFKEVFWVPGNHEFYSSKGEKMTYTEKLELCERICSGFSNVHFMFRKVRQIPGWNMRIAGCTMWTEILPENQKIAYSGMNDSRCISITKDIPAMPSDFDRWHSEDKKWLSNEMSLAEKAQEDMIILTHHLPSFKLIHSKYEEHPLNFCFASNLEQLMKPPVRGWLCGHSHTASEMDISGVRCGLNPFGYPGEGGSGYSPEKVIEIICDSDELPPYGYCDCDCDGDCDCDEYFDFDDNT